MRKKVEAEIEIHKTMGMKKEIEIYLELSMKMAMAREVKIRIHMDMQIQMEIDMAMVIGTGMDVEMEAAESSPTLHQLIQSPVRRGMAGSSRMHLNSQIFQHFPHEL